MNINTPSTQPDNRMTTRRSFLTRFLHILGITAIAPILYAVSAVVYPPLAGKRQRAATLVLDNPDEVFSTSDYAIIKVGDKDAILFQKADKSYEAMSLQCTHAGCSLEWKDSSKQFLCGCHGGAFHRDGSVAVPPPTRPLEHLTVRAENGRITIIDKPGNG